MSCLQCESTGLHASHTQYCFIDPPHKDGHFSVDVKHILLNQTKVEPGYGKDQVTLAQMSDPPRLTRPARTPSTVRAPPLSPWVICWNLLKYWLFPHLAASFLVAACTKHALTVGESGFLHICLAINWSRDWNLDWECWICYFTERDWLLWKAW